MELDTPSVRGIPYGVMANLSLAQLRDLQKSIPPRLDEVAERIVGPCPSAATAGPAASASLPLQASAPVPAVASGGYCRIFPADFPSLAHVTPDWKAQNWVGNGPWQHLEGWPAHPDFEANLLAVETSPEVVGAFPGK